MYLTDLTRPLDWHTSDMRVGDIGGLPKQAIPFGVAVRSGRKLLCHPLRSTRECPPFTVSQGLTVIMHDQPSFPRQKVQLTKWWVRIDRQG